MAPSDDGMPSIPYRRSPLQDPSGAARLAVAPPAMPEKFVESSWYSRVDYFHWNERVDGQDFVNESGPLITVGYTHRFGPERFRFEFFGGNVDYEGGGQFDDGSVEPLYATTGYIGARGEYDLLLEPDWLPRMSFVLGVGTRFWFRDLRDGVSEMGNPVMGYQEAWWTIYPYIGLETRRVPHDGIEWFASGRIGATPFTYEHVSWFDVTLHPRIGLTGQVEAGLRSRWLFVSGYFEAMSWNESRVVRDMLQPDSCMLTAGLKAGITF